MESVSNMLRRRDGGLEACTAPGLAIDLPKDGSTARFRCGVWLALASATILGVLSLR